MIVFGKHVWWRIPSAQQCQRRALTVWGGSALRAGEEEKDAIVCFGPTRKALYITLLLAPWINYSVCVCVWVCVCVSVCVCWASVWTHYIVRCHDQTRSIMYFYRTYLGFFGGFILISHVWFNSSSSLFCFLTCTLYLKDCGFFVYMQYMCFLNGVT